jgi:YVTN family beta-propeller protein
MKKTVPIALGAALALAAAFVLVAALDSPRAASKGEPDISVTTVDLLAGAGLEVNGIGPQLLAMDAFRNRLVVANTASSSVSIVDCGDRSVRGIPLGGRSLQHLKSEALAIRRKTGGVYLIGAKCFSIVDPDGGSAKTIPTPVQFESIAVDEATGNAFLAGRESAELGFYSAKSGTLAFVPWLATREDLVNLNATPPPPIRKVVAAPELGWIVAVDGHTSSFFLFDGRGAKLLNSRATKLTSGGRWHLAGYNEATHALYLVVETNDRRVIEAAKIDVVSGASIVAALPGYTEGVGIRYNPARDEVYVPYDNHPSVHVVDWRAGGELHEIALPAYGNDASAVDERGGVLYVGSWAHGEVDVVDLAARKLVKRIENLGVVPHQFAMVFDPGNGLLYYPRGATAVNGTFGAAVTALDPATGGTTKIYTGWAPVDLVEAPSRGSVLVFNNEDEFAEVRPDGRFERRRLPVDHPVSAIRNPEGNVYLSYGAHQSYWPVVYIWGARNGILRIDAKDLGFYDRRIPRQAHRMAFDAAGTLYFTQNNWGSEQQFVGTLPDEVRLFDIGRRLALPDTVDREITQRILEYDASTGRLYLARLPERDGDPSVLQIVDPSAKRVVHRMTVGRTAADLVFDDENIYIANFDSRSVSVIDKRTFAAAEIPAGGGPLALCRFDGSVWVANHSSNGIQEVRAGAKERRLPRPGRPDNLFAWNGRLVVTSHDAGALSVWGFDPAKGTFSLLHRAEYPYGDTSFDSKNVSFFVPGQFADAVFSITKGATAADGSLWIADFLSGRIFILEAR